MGHLTRAAVWNTDPVSITYFDQRDMTKYGFTDEDAFIVWYTDRLKAGQLAGQSYTLINKSDIPADGPDRDCWRLNGLKVEVDAAKAAAKQAKKAERDAVLSKLKISEDELAKILRQ